MPASPSLVSSAPTRIDLAGGTIDIWPLYLFHEGAATVNAAISLRAHVEIVPRTDDTIELRALDAGVSVAASNSAALALDTRLPLLVRLARHYRLQNATLVTRGESPTGAGIAGSSALTIAACGALARWTSASEDPDDLLLTAMNVECQTIHVPTGVQDYRPALYGGIASIELGVDEAGKEEAPPVNARFCAGSSVEPGAKAASGAVRISYASFLTLYRW